MAYLSKSVIRAAGFDASADSDPVAVADSVVELVAGVVVPESAVDTVPIIVVDSKTTADWLEWLESWCPS